MPRARSRGRPPLGPSGTRWGTVGRRSSGGSAISAWSSWSSLRSWPCSPSTDHADVHADMIPLATGLSYFDLDFMHLPRIIATVVVHGTGGVVLIDPGPSSTLPRLRATLAAAGISMDDVTTVLLTHIHLDHAGATGTLVKELPKLRVFVHEKGAPHMANPDKLLASATRLYGSDMDRLWGEVLPVPATSLEILQGGERLAVGNRMFDVEYTPGHASHHVSYFDRDSGVAMVGDTA